MELFGWEEAVKEQEESGAAKGRYRIGVGMAAATHGNGVYGVCPDTTGVILKMNEDGSVVMFTASGQALCPAGDNALLSLDTEFFLIVVYHFLYTPHQL